MDKTQAKKIGIIAFNVIMYLFLTLCIIAVFLTVFSKRESDGAAEIFGYQMRVVTSDSMAECELTDVSEYKIKDIPIRSMVFVKVIPDDPSQADEFYRSLKVGDVLTFRYVYTTQVTITHRITAITEKETGGFIIELAGDNKSSKDGTLTQVIDTSIPNSTNYVIGKVTGQARGLGTLISFLKQPIGIILLIILPCAIIIFIEVLKVLRMLSADKKQREQEEKDKKDSELEELRRRISEMERAQATSSKTSDPPPDSQEDTAE